MRIAIYQPDIPQNTGTIMRLAACLGVALDIIEPTGFDLTDRALRRAGMDYIDQAAVLRHEPFETFDAWRRKLEARLIVVSARATTSHLSHAYQSNDILLLGRESAGLPEHVHAIADARVSIPMRPGLRSLNIAVAGAIILGEALRQTNGFPIRPADS